MAVLNDERKNTCRSEWPESIRKTLPILWMNSLFAFAFEELGKKPLQSMLNTTEIALMWACMNFQKHTCICLFGIRI